MRRPLISAVLALPLLCEAALAQPRRQAMAEPTVTGSISPTAVVEARPASFEAFVAGLWPAARARGVSRATFDRAFAGVTPDPKIIELTHRQSEFVKPIWAYLDGAVSEARVARGREMAARYDRTLAAIERKYGVERSVVLGVWGMETNYGSFTGGKDVIRSLATLASIRYRGAFFRDELLTALVILQQGHVSRADMKGSWAGAMGQTQFMPSSFMKYAVDGDGDGRKDIWTSVPDALASTANYLKKHGWKHGLPWAVEVRLPHRFDYRTRSAALPHWAALGLRRADGRALPHGGEASLFMPAGARGPVFLVTANFKAIKAYNSSDSYALGVGHLGERVTGGSRIVAAWPTDEPQLDHGQRRELQARLASFGYAVGEPDGRIGTKTRDALRDFQQRRGLVPDGHPSLAMLEALRGRR
ncbi:lytic murein transglycosylase [Alsobacter soli]|uniref:Lytic murein transglycosylase n=1 Tax=Alsobacter soli TaxID=2109933 RepID=A0A2T1HZF9_9HYPH|nr:lytic murein transglycosylase [Alsobacter soli]PSC07071.1 lytic murein transglycosylase [Alsobacter soli]